MHFKRYIVLTIIFLLIVSAYTYLNIEALYNIDFFGINIELPVAVWVILPALLILAGSIIHFGFYSAFYMLKKSRLEKDLNKNKDIVKNALLHNKYNPDVKDKRYKVITDLLANSRLYVDYDYAFENDELNEVISDINNIMKGNYTEISKYKLSTDNEYFVKNQLNKLQSDPLSAEKILKDCHNSDEVCEKAFEVYVKSAEKRKINKIALPKTKSVVISMLERYNTSENQLELSTEEIIELCKEADFTQDDFIQIAKILQKNLGPDEFLEMCFLLQKEIDAACSAYMYANLELERNDIANEYLEQFEDNDLVKFRYYMILKEKGQKVTLGDFV